MTTGGNERGLRWEVWVDWAGSGVWGAAGADVSDDVLALRWEWGRRGLPAPEFAPPATLELTLRNEGHRYTPGKTDGPLGANVRAGREVWLRAAYRYDDFATPAAVSLNGRVSADGGGRWEVMAAPGNGFEAQDGTARAVRRGRATDGLALLDTGDPRVTLMARYRRSSNGQGGFALRALSPRDCLRLRFGDTATILERVSGGNITQLASGPALDALAWYELEMVQEDGGVRVYATKLNAGGVARQEILVAEPIEGAPASGRHGLWNEFQNTSDRWGEWRVGRSLFVGRITGLAPDYDAGVCRVTAADGMHELESAQLQRGLADEEMQAGEVAAEILGWAGRSTNDYRLDAGRTLVTGGPRSVWEVSAANALRRLQREENGLIYADGLGRIRLEAASRRAAIRSHRNPAALARVSVSDRADAGAAYIAAARREDGAAGVEDAVTFRYRRLADAGRQQVWSLNEPLEVMAGEEHLLLAAGEGWAAIAGVQTPVAGSDYAATADAAGEGADATASVSVTVLPEGESGVSGRGAMLRVRNTGARTVYVQRLRLWAERCWRSLGTTAYRAAVPASSSSSPGATAAGGVRERVVRCYFTDNYAAAQGAAGARVAERGVARAQAEVSLPLGADANRRAAVEARISDVAAMSAATAGISGAWVVEGMAVTVDDGGEGTAGWWLTAV